jgi:hypothetical protein
MICSFNGLGGFGGVPERHIHRASMMMRGILSSAMDSGIAKVVLERVDD